MSRKRFQPPEPPRPATGAVMEDSISRCWVVIQSGAFQIRVKQLSQDGKLAKDSVVLDLSVLKPTGKRVTIRVGDLT